MIQTNYGVEVKQFLWQDRISTLHIQGIIENEPAAKIYVNRRVNPTWVVVDSGCFYYIHGISDENWQEVVLPLFEHPGEYNFSALQPSLAKKMQIEFKGKVTWTESCGWYWKEMKNVQGKVKELPAVKLEDAKLVDAYYTYRDEGSREYIEECIRNRPSAAVYIKNKLVSWALVHQDNSIGVMYTLDDHRRQGYGEIVTRDLMDKIAKRGKTPYLQINEKNAMSPGLAKKCGFSFGGMVEWFGIQIGNPLEKLLK